MYLTLSKRQTNIDQECQQCQWYEYCQGGCMMESWLNLLFERSTLKSSNSSILSIQSIEACLPYFLICSRNTLLWKDLSSFHRLIKVLKNKWTSTISNITADTVVCHFSLLYRWLEEETRVIRNYICDVINDYAVFWLVDKRGIFYQSLVFSTLFPSPGYLPLGIPYSVPVIPLFGTVYSFHKPLCSLLDVKPVKKLNIFFNDHKGHFTV
jgi:hypothetical protein